MDVQQRINQQRINHIVDSYLLQGNGSHDDASAAAVIPPKTFENYLSDLISQYPHGLIELALVETLVKSWLTLPMKKGIPFLTAAHNRLKAWQEASFELAFTPSQFTQITGLDAHIAFNSLKQPSQLSPPTTADSSQ